MTPKTKAELKRNVRDAITACYEKKAERISVLQLDKEHGGFTDYFVICSGTNPRQIQAISDEVEQKLLRAGLNAVHVEGYKQAEWVLLDYVDFVVHVFSERAREFYDLERLWKSARRLEPSDLSPAERKKGAALPAPAPMAKAAKATRRARKSPAN